MRKSLTRTNLDRLDRIVWMVLLSLGLATGLLLLRGDQIGVQVGDRFPAAGSDGVSTRTEIRLTFDDAMDKASTERRFHIEPEVEGELRWRGKTLVWRPQAGLSQDTHYTITLQAGARSARGRALKTDLTWSFHTGRPRVVFMSFGEASQLYKVSLDDLTVRQLTRFEDGSGLWDYAVSPDGNQIAFALVRPDAKAVDLWLMNADGSDARRVVTCDDSQCSGATWAPDSRRLAYERRALNADIGGVGGGLGPPRIWLLDLNSGQTTPLFQDSQMLGYMPRWSPDGGRLAYFDPQGGVRVMDMETGDTQLIPNQRGETGDWSPDGQTLALVDMTFVGEGFLNYIVRADLGDGTTRNLSGEENQVDDGSPAWSPQGDWIAFGRKALADGTPTPGQQLWLMRPDGGDAHPLVTDPQAYLGAVAWAPHGRALTYQRFPLMQANARPEIWLFSFDDGVATKLTDNGTLASWLP